MDITVILKSGAQFTMTGLEDFTIQRSQVTGELVGYSAEWGTGDNKVKNRSAPHLNLGEVVAFVREPRISLRVDP